MIPRHDKALPAWLKWAYGHVPGARALRRTANVVSGGGSAEFTDNSAVGLALKIAIPF